jgi:hypothetical protein
MKRQAEICYARRMRAKLLCGASLVASVTLCCLPVSQAYQNSLDGKALQEAYILGQRNDQTTGDFLAPYLREMTDGHGDLRVAEIEILTPFAQVVDDSRKNTSGYTEEQANKKYQERGNTVTVSVTLMLPAAYPQPANGNGTAPAAASSKPDGATAGSDPAAGTSASAQTAGHPGDTQKPQGDAPVNANLQPETFWQKFQFSVKQNGKNIPSKSIHNTPIYSTATKGTPSVLDGAAVTMEFDAKDVASQGTEVEVTTPDGKTISTTFDLKKLR